jgi:hypothetical protein
VPAGTQAAAAAAAAATTVPTEPQADAGATAAACYPLHHTAPARPQLPDLLNGMAAQWGPKLQVCL